MKTFLFRPSTQLYLQGIDKWTSDPEHAFDFKFVDRARSFIEIWGMKDVELAFAFNDLTGIPTGPLEAEAALTFKSRD